MPSVLSKESVLWCISHQKLGFEFGTPERVDPDSLAVVLPILRHSVTGRSYTTFPETDQLTVKDSGSISTMTATNKSDISVFLRSGTIFKGATQERASLRSMIVLPGATVDIKVRCIHATRGITRNADVKYGGNVPLHFEQQVYTAGFQSSDQHKYWASATSTSNRMMAMNMAMNNAAFSGDPAPPQRFSLGHGGVIGLRSFDAQPIIGADDLSSNLADFSKSFDAVLSKVKLVDDQVGLGLITDKGVETVEIFDAHDSWRALHEDAVKRLGPNLANKDKSGVFEYKPEKAIAIVQDVLGLDFKENEIYTHKPSNGDPAFSVTGLSADKYTGEVVEYDGKVIHLLLIRLQ